MHVTNTRREDTNGSTSNVLVEIVMYRPGRCRAYKNTNNQTATLSRRKPARVEAAAVAPAAGPGSSRIGAPADRSIASAVLAAGGSKARLFDGTSCTASSLARAEADAIASELLRPPRDRATQAHQCADVSPFHLFRAHHQILRKIQNKIKTEQRWYDRQ